MDREVDRKVDRKLLPALVIALALATAACGTSDDLVFTSDDSSTTTNVTAATVTAENTVETTTPDPTVATTETRTVRMAFTGDTLPHSPLWRRAAEVAGGNGYDFFPMFADIEPIISAVDLAICHLETPIAPEGEEYTSGQLYGVPPQIVGAMARAGFDRCSTASNHVLDRGVAGIDRTVDVLEENGMGQSGMARAEIENFPDVFDVGDVRVGHLSYTYATNGIPIPSAEPWRTNLIDPVRIIRDARSARDLGADVVVVSIHWGTERESAPNDQQLAVADEITASGAIDLVIGHHAHVLQPITQVNGVWVAYGIGNILSNLPVSDYWPASSQDAAIVEFTVTVDQNDVATVAPPVVIPTWVDKGNGWVIRDVRRELERNDLSDFTRSELQRSLDRSAAVVGDYFA